MEEKQYFYGEVNYTSLVQAKNTLNRIMQTAQNEAEKWELSKPSKSVMSYREESWKRFLIFGA